MGRRQAIPILRSGNNAIDQHAAAVKSAIDTVTGQHPNAPALKKLAATATLPEVIVQLNLVIDRLQGT